MGALLVLVLAAAILVLPGGAVHVVPSTGHGSPLSVGPSHPTGFGTAKYAILVGCDGLGGLYLENATDFLPNFSRLIKGGTTTMRARTRMPSVSAPNWCSMITSQAPEESGVIDNAWVPQWDDPVNTTVEPQMPPISGRGYIPETMWRVAKAQDPHVQVAVSISWDWMYVLTESTTVDMLNRGHEDDANVTKAMLQFFQAKKKPTLSFVHFDSIDESGHASFWGSPKYYQAVKAVDGYLGELLEGLDTAGMLDSTLLIVTADHGGYRSSHGNFNEANMFIPVLINGPGIPAGQIDSRYITDLDFAPTMLNALGLTPGVFMRGRILEELYHR